MPWLLVFMLGGCSGSGSDDVATIPNGETGDTTDTTDTPGTVPAGSLYVYDFLTGAPVEGVTVAVDGALLLTDAAGIVALDLAPSTLFDFALSHPSYLTSTVRIVSGAGLWRFGEAFVTPSAADDVSASFGRSRDPAKATVVVSVEALIGSLDLPEYAPLVGATVGLDVPSGLTFVTNAAGVPTEGATILAGGANYVVFLDVDPGEVRFTVTPPGAEVCVTAMEHDVLVDVLPVAAGQLSTTIVHCD